MNDSKLTKQQCHFVEQNYGLILSFLKQHGLDIDNHEDFYGACAIGLCKAVKDFDDSKGYKFSTYAYFRMNSEIISILQKLKKDVQYTACDIYEEENPLNYIADEFDFDEFINNKCIQESFVKNLNKLNDRDKFIIKQIYIKNKTFDQIAKELNISRQRVGQISNRFKTTMKKDLMK